MVLPEARYDDLSHISTNLSWLDLAPMPPGPLRNSVTIQIADIHKSLQSLGYSSVSEFAHAFAANPEFHTKSQELVRRMSELERTIRTGHILEGNSFVDIFTFSLPGSVVSAHAMPSGDVAVDMRYRLDPGRHAFGIAVVNPRDGRLVYQSDVSDVPDERCVTQIEGVTSQNDIVFRRDTPQGGQVEVWNPYTGQGSSSGVLNDFHYSYSALRDEVTIVSNNGNKSIITTYDAKRRTWESNEAGQFLDILFLYGVLPEGNLVIRGHETGTSYIVTGATTRTPSYTAIHTSSDIRVLENGGMVYSGQFFGRNDETHDGLAYIPPQSAYETPNEYKTPVDIKPGSTVIMTGGFGGDQFPTLLVADMEDTGFNTQNVGRIRKVRVGEAVVVDMGNFLYHNVPCMTTVGNSLVLASGPRVWLLETRQI